MSAREEPLARQLLLPEGELLVGDAGLLLARALVEHGVDYVACDPVDPAHPLDAVIAGLGSDLLAAVGIRLRLRRDAARARQLIEPSLRTFDPRPGAVVIPPTPAGHRLAAELLDVTVAAPVVVVCPSSVDAMDVGGVVAVPSVRGLTAAIDAAFQRSRERRTPTFVQVGDSALVVRGTHRCRSIGGPHDDVDGEPDTRSSSDALADRGQDVEPVWTPAAIDVPPGARLPGPGGHSQSRASARRAAALELAQIGIGIPPRLELDHPTYRTPTGRHLTVVDADRFVAHGLHCAHPAGRGDVFLVSARGSVVARALALATEQGATCELADERRPLRVARSVARACAESSPIPHVIVLAEIAEPMRAIGCAGVEPEVGGVDRAALAIAGADAMTLAAPVNAPDRTPLALPADERAVASAVDHVGEVSAGWYELAIHERPSRLRRAMRTLSCRFSSLVAGVDA